MKRVRAVGIVIDNERVLLMYRKLNGKEYYVFPGGGVEEGETVEDCVKRELYEETSLSVKVEKLLYHLSDQAMEHYFYLCSYLEGEPALGNGNEMEAMTADNVYRPEWHMLSELSNLLVYQLEVRDWLIEDLKNGFKKEPRETFIPASELKRNNKDMDEPIRKPTEDGRAYVYHGSHELLEEGKPRQHKRSRYEGDELKTIFDDISFNIPRSLLRASSLESCYHSLDGRPLTTIT
jgi:mutator protein MutT